MSVKVAIVAALVATVSVLGVPIAAAIGVVGVVAVTVGLVLCRRALIEFAGGALGLAIVVGGGLGASPAAVGIAALAAVVAWDVADHAADLGEQIGRNARTRRNELAHAGGSLLIGAVAGAIVYGVFLGMAGGQPTTALAFLLVGAIALVAALR